MQGNIKKILTKNNINYALLSYIESTGIQYINTGFYPAVNRKFEIDCSITFSGSDAPVMFGAVNSSSGRFDVYGYQGKAWYRTANSSINASLDHSSNERATIGMYSTGSIKHYFKNGVEYTQNETMNSGFGVVNIMRRGQSSETYAPMKLYGFKIWDNVNELKLNLIPVERISDGAIGMLDLVSGNFFTNAGSGVFSKGDYLVEHLYKTHITKDNEEVEEVEYIEGSGTQCINTELTPQQNRKVEVDFQFTTPRVDDVLFGCRDNTYRFDCYVNANVNGFTVRSAPNTTNMNQPADLSLRHKVLVYFDSSKRYSILDGETPVSMSSSPVSFTKKIFLFARSLESADVNNFGRFKNYGTRIYDNDVLKLNLIPVKYGNEYCMLDLVENKLYHNAGTGSFTGGNLVELQKLEEVIISNNTMYYKLDYLQSSGTQYIKTGYKPNNKTKAFLDVELIGISGETNYPAIFGSRTTNHNNDTFMACRNNDVNAIRTEMGNAKYAYFNYSANTRYNLEFNYQYVKVNGTQYNTGQTSFPQSNQNIFLFGLNQGGALETQYGKFIQKLYSARFEEDDVKLNLIPAERVSDNVKGMLDTLSGTFYTNSGSGTFAGNRKQIILVE